MLRGIVCSPQLNARRNGTSNTWLHNKASIGPTEIEVFLTDSINGVARRLITGPAIVDGKSSSAFHPTKNSVAGCEDDPSNGMGRHREHCECDY